MNDMHPAIICITFVLRKIYNKKMQITKRNIVFSKWIFFIFMSSPESLTYFVSIINDF